MQFRPYDADRDRDALHRIWREVGWLEDNKQQKEALDLFVAGGSAMVAELDGEAECAVLTMPATIKHLEADLPMSAVTAVTTSHVARRQGLASRLLARTLADDVADGAVLASLGIFDQGYYDRLGFGSGAYDHYVSFDPARLAIDARPRVPVRVTREDWEQVHAARLGRWRRHGAVSLLPSAFTRAEMLWNKSPWGLGYRDGADGSLSHYIWGRTRNSERGPYHIDLMAYENREQFLELLALLKSLGDQVHSVQLTEPPDVQMQDLMEEPAKQRKLTSEGKYAAEIRAGAWWQVRICDLEACLAQTSLPGADVRFNLDLEDPAARYLEESWAWSGVGGRYTVSLGRASHARRGHTDGLPVLRATVNAFTRLWLGVQRARGLVCTGELAASKDLLRQLDDALLLPRPLPDWGF